VKVKRGLFCALILIIFLQVQITLGKTCQQCHSLNKLVPNGVYLHKPFMEGHCEKCHGGMFSKKIVNLTNIKWFLARHTNRGTSYIILSPRLEKYNLVFQVEDFQEQFILLPSEASNLPNSSVPPQILKTQFCGLEKGPWIEAKICVQTNIPTEVYISCGDNVEGYSEGDYFTNHEILLTRLKENQTYICTVNAKDILGNSAPSKSFSFNISNPIQNSFKKVVTSPKNVSVKLYHSPAGELILAIMSNSDIDWRLGGVSTGSLDLSKEKKIKDHPKINSLKWSSIDACYTCHPKNRLGVSHPVNVPLSKNISIDKDIPLQNGVVTCASCHNPHGSLYPSYLRKKGEALCLSCHKQRYQ